VGWFDDHEFAEVVALATRAPSMHNTQPWRFRQGEGWIELLADPDRRLAVADPSGWASRLACGAALFNLRLALAVRGVPATAQLLPDQYRPEILARLTPEPPRPPTPLQLRLHAAIRRRHSNRGPFVDATIPVDARVELVAAARAEHGWLDLLIGPVAVEATAELVRRAHRELSADPAYQAEISAWTRGGRVAADGVPVGAAGPAPGADEMLPRKDFGGQPLPAHRSFEREPLLAVLGVPGDWPADQLQAGQVLQRVLLTATDHGLAVSMFSAPIEVPTVREQLRLAVGRNHPPQMLLRCGYAVPAQASPRRPVSEVLTG
jgi:nitroreductase